MAPVTITIDDSDSESDLQSKAPSRQKQKQKPNALLSSSPNAADDSLPDLNSLLGRTTTTTTSTTSNAITHQRNTSKTRGKFRYANLQHTSSPPPEIQSSSPIQSFSASSQPANTLDKNAGSSSTLNRLDSNTMNGASASTSGSRGIGLNGGNDVLGKRSTSTSSILNGLDALKNINGNPVDDRMGGVQSLDKEAGKINSNNNLKRKAISLPSRIPSINSNKDQNTNSAINLCDSDSDQDSGEEGELNIKIPKPSKTISSKGKGKGKGKADQNQNNSKNNSKERSLFLGQEDSNAYDSLEDDLDGSSPIKKSKSNKSKSKPPTTSTSINIDSDLEFDQDFDEDFSFSRIEDELKSKNKNGSNGNRASTTSLSDKDKDKGKEVQEISSSPPPLPRTYDNTTTTTNKKKKKRDFEDSDDSMDWDEPPTNVKKGKSNSGNSVGIGVDKGKNKATDAATRAANAELKRMEKEEAKAERAREAAEKKAWKQVNLKATSREFRMTEVIVDIDSAYLSKITDPSIPIDFDPILSEHGEALFQRLRDDKAEVNSIPIGKGLKPTSISNLDSILYQLDNSSSDSKILLPTIRFRRKVNYTLDIKRRTKAPLPNGEIRTFVEPTTLILLTSKFLSGLIRNNKLLEEVQKIRNATDIHHQIFVLIVGLNEDWKKDLLKKQRDYTKSIRRALDNPDQINGNHATLPNASTSISGNDNEDGVLSKVKVETELMRLRIALRAFVVNVNSKEDAADWVHNIACDVATRTDKLIEASHLSFCPDKTAKSAPNSKEAYSQMLQSIPRITEHAANGIMAKYPTLRSLIEAYEDLASQDNNGNRNGNRNGDPNQAQLEMLSHCQVSHRTDGQASGRNFDKGLSRRVAQVMMGKDPLMLI